MSPRFAQAAPLTFEGYAAACPFIRPLPEALSACTSIELAELTSVLRSELWAQTMGLEDANRSIRATAWGFVLGTATHLAVVTEALASRTGRAEGFT